jgi:hypothetical protein
METNATAGEAPMADMAMDGKPMCGGDKQVGEYDVGIHVLGLCKLLDSVGPFLVHVLILRIVLVLAFSIFGMDP